MKDFTKDPRIKQLQADMIASDIPVVELVDLESALK